MWPRMWVGGVRRGVALKADTRVMALLYLVCCVVSGIYTYLHFTFSSIKYIYTVV